MGLLLLLTGALDLFLDGAELADNFPLLFPGQFLGAARFPQVGHLPFQVGQALFAGGILLAAERGALDLHLHHLAVNLVNLGGEGINLDAELGGGLVNEVNGLVGEEPVGDVAVGKVGRGDDGRILDANAVVHLVLFLQPPQDGDGGVHLGLVDHDLLEAPLQRGVPLDVFPVLVNGGRPHAAQRTARQGRLEHVGGVNVALGGAGSDDGVQLVNEQDDRARGLLNGGNDGLEAILEVPPELRPRDQRAQIQRQDVLVAQGFRDVP